MRTTSEKEGGNNKYLIAFESIFIMHKQSRNWHQTPSRLASHEHPLWPKKSLTGHLIIYFRSWTESHVFQSMKLVDMKDVKNKTQSFSLCSVSIHRKSKRQQIQWNGTPTDISTSEADLVAHGLRQPAKWYILWTFNSSMILEHSFKQVQLC